MSDYIDEENFGEAVEIASITSEEDEVIVTLVNGGVHRWPFAVLGARHTYGGVIYVETTHETYLLRGSDARESKRWSILLTEARQSARRSLTQHFTESERALGIA